MTTRPKRIGRPPLPTNARRRNRVTIMLTDREAVALRRAADRAEALGTAARRVLLGALGRSER